MDDKLEGIKCYFLLQIVLNCPTPLRGKSLVDYDFALILLFQLIIKFLTNKEDFATR